MKKKLLLWCGAFVSLALLMTSCQKEPASIVKIQDHPNDHILDSFQVFATGLNNPRGLKFGPDSMLYVAEGGIGGKNSTAGQCTQVIPPIGPYTGAPTGGRISKIDSYGKRFTVTDQLPTTQTSDTSGALVSGVGDIAFCGKDLYALITGGGCSHANTFPNSLVKINPDGSNKIIADLSKWIRENPVKSPEQDDSEPDGDWYSMIQLNGAFYAVEANHGQLVKITPTGNIKRVVDVSATYGHIVPTSVAVCGDFFIGNLNPFPIIEGSSSVYKVTSSGNISVHTTGFSTILGLVFDKQGNLYVLENTTGNPFPTPGTGKVIRVDKSGNKTTIASGLVLPTGITIGPDGSLYVSNVGFGPFSTKGAGQILRMHLK